MQTMIQGLGTALVGDSISVEPSTVLVSWTDDAGAHPAASLLTFATTAHLDKVTELNVGPAADAGSAKATRIAGLSALPKLVDVDVSGNAITALITSENKKLAVIDASDNLLTTNAVNFILFWSLDLTTASTSIDLSGQTPPAPPSAGPPNGAAAKNILLIDGWAVTTD